MKCWLSSLLSLVILAACATAAVAGEPAAKKIRVLLTYGGHDFEQKPFFAMFDALPEVTYAKAELPKDAGLLKPGLEKDYDVLVMYDMVPAITPEQQQAFVALLQKGIGVVSLHHNMGAHRDWDEFRKIIGGKFFVKEGEVDGKKYSQSGWAHGGDLRITVADKQHPVTKGVEDFQIKDETYNKYYVAPNVKVLLKTDNPQNDPNVAWVTKYGQSRVFYFMLGHDHLAWENPAYPKLLAQGIRWAAGK
jgi:type 1 glutamine amidotransferase